MLRRWPLLVGIAIVFFVAGAPCWGEPNESYEPWKGEVTVRLNVRKAPGSTSEIITQIDEGERIDVREESEGWYKVVVEEETFGFIGWVFGKYVKTAGPRPDGEPHAAARSKPEPERGPDTPRKTVNASQSRLNEPAPKAEAREAVEINVESKESQVSGHVESSPVAKQRNAAAAPQPPTTAKERREVSEEKAAPQKSPNRETSIEKVQEDPIPASEKSEPSPLAERELSEDVKPGPQPRPQLPANEKGPDKEMMRFEKDALPGDTLKDQTRPGQGHGVEKSEKALFVHPPAEASANKNEGFSFKGLMGVLIKLMVVAFSCVALIISQRAWRLAKAASMRR